SGGGYSSGGGGAIVPAIPATPRPTPTAAELPSGEVPLTPWVSMPPGVSGKTAAIDAGITNWVSVDGCILKIPAGAVPPGTVITLEREREPKNLPSGLGSPVSGVYSITTSLAPADSNGFISPGEVLIVYDAEKVRNKHDLAIYYYDEIRREWVFLGGELNPERQAAITASYGGFARVAVFENPLVRTFFDVPRDHWAYAYIRRLAALGIIDGYAGENGIYTYNPNGDITRAEIIKLIVATLGHPLEQNFDGARFADWDSVPDWAKPYIGAAVKAGIVLGSREGDQLLILADDSVTRQEMVAMAVRALGIEVPAGESNRVSDFYETDEWARDTLAFALNNGMINIDGGVSRPHANAARAESAMVLFKLLEYLMK
ncbi:MAG: S-layer homology domain-containing protein, partial [Clostridiales bacterium]|nr:S-layer homology domain-containing protein [Clostridiales bacterium]